MLRITPINVRLGKPLLATDNVMSVSSQDAVTLNAYMVVGDHTYFTLQDARGFETVKYTHTSNIAPISGYGVLPLDRAQHNTTRKSWPAEQCLLVLNTEGVLKEFICANMGAC